MGLEEWGLDEEFASARAWMSGNEVRLCLDFTVSHRYHRNWEKLKRIDTHGTEAQWWTLKYNQHYIAHVLWGEESYWKSHRHFLFREDMSAFIPVSKNYMANLDQIRKDSKSWNKVLTNEQYKARMESIEMESLIDEYDTTRCP